MPFGGGFALPLFLKIKSMEKSHFCGILYEDGQQFITMPNGEKIPAQIETTVTDIIGEKSIATVKLIVDLREVKVKETK